MMKLLRRQEATGKKEEKPMVLCQKRRSGR